MPIGTDPDTIIQALNAAGVDFSVPEADLKQWLADTENTPYPAVSEALLKLLGVRRLRRPVFIDVIVYNYEQSPGEPSPRRPEDVHPAILESAVIEGFNNRHGEHNNSFKSLLKPLDLGGHGQNGIASVALRSYNYPDRYIRHANFFAELAPVVNDLDRRDATFAMVPGLWFEDSGPGLVSFQSLNFPDHFLRRDGFRLRLDKRTDDPAMRNDASFFKFKGWADPAGSTFESRSLPSHFLRHRDSHIFVEQLDPHSDLDRKDATFRIVEGFLPLPPDYCQHSEKPYSAYADTVPLSDADAIKAGHALLYLVNVERLNAGLATLCYQGQLAIAARAHSQNWATDPGRTCPPHNPPLGCGHWDSRPGYAWPEDRFAKSGYEPLTTGENTQNGGGVSDGTNVVPAGWTWGTPKAAVYWWMNHDPENNYAKNGHRAAILNPDFRDAGPGVGCYTDQFGNSAATFTLMFGAR
ncbi:AbfB domain-containing protein [Nocardia farcinica]|uniref:AbfB domain-containing protein n=1 Tax=Nocardia farcinica TaxID=37329 RepID=UPI00245566C4|nr:AbfB domain-containing protein [Nocardia farcinica]